jgi:predicted nucleotidyltransferase
MFGIYQKTTDELMSIFEKYIGIEKVIIYGSRAKGNYKEGSDIDLTLIGNVQRQDLMNILEEIDDSYIPYLFDISIYNDLNSESLKEHINRVGKIFYKRI